MNAEYNKVSPLAKKSWRIGQIIKLVIAAAAAVGLLLLIGLIELEVVSTILYIVLALLMIYRLIALVLFPRIEYAQWGYLIEEDKVVIKHGIFFIDTVIIPVIRIQNITMSQGPVNRKLGLYNIEIALASGNHEIKGLDKETAESISENLKARLYKRIEERGEV